MRERTQVLWFGNSPSDQVLQEFKNRQLSVLICDQGDNLPSLHPVLAATFMFSPMNVEELATFAKAQAPGLLDYGIRIDLVAADDVSLGRAQSILGEVAKLPDVNARTAPADFEIPEKVARHPNNVQPRIDLDIQMAGNREPIPASDLPLFRRAFSMCKKIVLSELGGGRSDARVFSVYATMDTSRAGVWPQPFFAKLDKRDKIIKEAGNYEDYAASFVPFGLRPNIKDVVLGGKRGLLVGDFVDRSESLWDLVRRNVAAQAISSLIDETLVGWRNQAYAQGPTDGSLAQVLELAGVCTPGDIKESYLEHARRVGSIAYPSEIWKQLTALPQKFRLAPIHGDLHGENVRVRNGQAILIDLASVANGPLTADLASLETWLSFELPPEDFDLRDQFENIQWREVVDDLYAPETFQHPPPPPDPTAIYCWLRSVVRQVRHMGIAVQSCPTEYQAAVAVQLLRRCQWDDGFPADRFRRAHGYVIASRLAADLARRPV